MSTPEPDPEQSLQDTTDELDERLEKLGDHIDEAESKVSNATLGDDEAPEDAEQTN
jgi:hypothetical protein